MSVCEQCWERASNIAASIQCATTDVYAGLVDGPCRHELETERDDLHQRLEDAERQRDLLLEAAVDRHDTSQANADRAVRMAREADRLRLLVRHMRSVIEDAAPDHPGWVDIGMDGLAAESVRDAVADLAGEEE